MCSNKMLQKKRKKQKKLQKNYSILSQISAFKKSSEYIFDLHNSFEIAFFKKNFQFLKHNIYIENILSE